MQGLLRLLVNLTLPLDWAWLGPHFIAHKSTTVRVVCDDAWCPGNEFLPYFVLGEISWSIHHTVNRVLPDIPRAEANDVVLFLSNSTNRSQEIIKTGCSGDFMSPFARYLVVQNSAIEEKDAQSIFEEAWEQWLALILVVGLKDRAIFAAYQKCFEPVIIKMQTLKWAHYGMLDLKGCELTAFFEDKKQEDKINFELDLFNESAIYWLKLYKYWKKKLKFRPRMVEENAGDHLRFAPVDFSIYPQEAIPSQLFISEIVWCIPDACTLRDTSYLLWEEFPLAIWLCLAISILVVTVAVHLTAVPRVSFGDSAIRIIGSVAWATIKLPNGHARWPLAGWLLSTIIIGTLYTSKFHSMMIAPFCHKMHGENELFKSNLSRVCSHEGFDAVFRTLSINLSIDARDSFVFRTKCPQRHHIRDIPDISTGEVAVLTTEFVCRFLKTKAYMTELPGFKLRSSLYAFPFMHERPFWLVPTLRRLASYAEAAGLIELWQRQMDGAQLRRFNLDDAARPIDLSLIQPVFFLLFGGYALAAIVFVLELVWAWWK